jgi:hypothetical protein
MRLTNPSGLALDATRADVTESVLLLDECRVLGGLNFTSIQIGGNLGLGNSKVARPSKVAINATRAHINENLQCNDGFRVEGEFRLSGAHIGRQLILTQAALTNPNRRVLDGDGAYVGGDAFLGGGFRAKGIVQLREATIGEQFNISGAVLVNPGGLALDISGIRVGTGVFGRNGLVEGELRAVSAKVGGPLSLRGAQLNNPGNCALTCDGLQVSDVRCDRDFRAAGELRFPGASIDGQFVLSGASITHPNGTTAVDLARAEIRESLLGRGCFVEGQFSVYYAHIGGSLALTQARLRDIGATVIIGQGVRVDGDIQCSEGFSARGEINMDRAQVGGEFNLAAADIDNLGACALRLKEATITALTLPSSPQLRVNPVDLTNASVVQFADDWHNAPYAASLSGFTYQRLSVKASWLSSRLGWLSSSEPEFSPQSYDQLRSTFRRAGRDDDGRRVAIAKEYRRRKHLGRSGRVVSWLLSVTVGYGYMIWRGVLLMAALAGIGTAVFAWAKAHHHMIALRASQLSPAERPVPHFHAWLYSLDTVLPIINLGQKNFWSPTGATQVWYACSVLSGWLLGTLILATLTARLVRD